MLIQLQDAVEATKKVGFETTAALILLIALITGFGFILRWLLKRSEAKDEEVGLARREAREEAAQSRKELLTVLDQRQEDLTVIQASLGVTAEAVRDGAKDIRQAFSDLANEIRRTK
jgi:uncharacterized protein HemX